MQTLGWVADPLTHLADPTQCPSPNAECVLGQSLQLGWGQR